MDEAPAEQKGDFGADSHWALCYRIYASCERKKRATEAMAYNSLVQISPEITRLAQATPRAAVPGTGDLFDDDGGRR